MRIEVLTWAEIIALPGARPEGYSESTGISWDTDTEEEFSENFPDRIIELISDELDRDNEYETEFTYIPEILVKRFIPDGPAYGTHKLLKRIEHVQT